MLMITSKEFYLSSKYLDHNPSWDEEQTPWKVGKILKLLQSNKLQPHSVCEVGCGSGGILAGLRNYLGSSCRLEGYDIAPALQGFWNKLKDKNITFIQGDFCESNDCYDLLLVMDVLEHVENPFAFLRQISRRAPFLIFHIPLELHAQGAFRNLPVIQQRQNVGHLHFWNKDLALLNLQACGLEIIHWEYTAGAVDQPTRLWSRKLARWPRRFFFGAAPDLAVRLMGGFSLLVLATAASAGKYR
jgi:SAM-dependent methyltransferase